MRWAYILIIFVLDTVSCLQVGKDQYVPKPPTAPKVEAKPYEYQEKPPKGAYIQPLHPKNPFDIKGDDVDKGGEVTKACRYDDPPWSDCDPLDGGCIGDMGVWRSNVSCCVLCAGGVAAGGGGWVSWISVGSA